MKKLLLIALAAGAGYLGIAGLGVAPSRQGASVDRNAGIEAAYENRTSDLQVEGEGTVVRILSDDLNGDRHQRFILRLESGQTLLVAHNIDLAPRVSGLREGDIVMFNGEYEWNSQGGVLHWTHHDPAGRHQAGWLKHNGRTYQ